MPRTSSTVPSVCGSANRAKLPMKIVAYAYEAAIHCPRCTLRRFHVDSEDALVGVLDREGNEVWPVFSIDENASGHCDTCGAEYGD